MRDGRVRKHGDLRRHKSPILLRADDHLHLAAGIAASSRQDQLGEEGASVDTVVSPRLRRGLGATDAEEIHRDEQEPPHPGCLEGV